MLHTVTLDGSPLTLAQVIAVARNDTSVALSDSSLQAMNGSRKHLEAIASDGEPHYGVNTGFGSLSRHRVDDDNLKQLQVNLIRSHASGVGELLPAETVRGMMLILAASLARGLSGVRPDLVQTIVEYLNNNITPAIPSVGSVGASGDLAPLAHLALALLGEGEVLVDGAATSTGPVLASHSLKPIQLEAKEGLALINGTHLMAAQASLAVHDTERLVRASLVAGAMSIDGCRASDSYLNDAVASARRHQGVTDTARTLRGLLAGSEILPSHQQNDPRVQDPYSFRCLAPVVGAVMGGIEYVRACLDQELGAVTDNPLVIQTGESAELISAGNFHGMPIALPLDHLTVSISHIAGMSERRVF